jgi:hypothetical protein
VNWYVSWPADTVRGIQISDRADFSGLEQRVFPPEWTAAVDSLRATLDVRGERDLARFLGGNADSIISLLRPADAETQMRELWGQQRRALLILRDVIRHDLFTLECARLVLKNEQPELSALYFRGADNAQHLFWKHRLAMQQGSFVAGAFYEEIGAAELEAFAPIIDRYYDFLDEVVGDIVSMLDPDTAIIVLSDHGFLTNNERGRWVHMNRLLEAAGLAAVVPNTGGAADSAASVAWDPAPPSVASVRMIRPGGAGAGDQREALERARRVILRARTDRGEKIAARLEIGDDAQGLYLRVTVAPLPRGTSVDIEGHSIPLSSVIAPEGHSGDHRMNGILIAAGPPFRGNAKIDAARAVDVAPTVLHLLGAPAARDMEGIVLRDLFSDEWWETHPLRSVESYGTREASEKASPTSADERIKEELRALGYIQ